MYNKFVRSKVVSANCVLESGEYLLTKERFEKYIMNILRSKMVQQNLGLRFFVRKAEQLVDLFDITWRKYR